MRFFLGVDGGGTKTSAALINEAGELLGYEESGPTNFLENGEETFRKNLRSAVKPLMDRAEGGELVSCFGLPAVGEFEESEKILSSVVESELGLKPNLIVNDVVVAWAGGTLCNDGVHVVAGTGTIAYGRRNENEVRVSGWGSLIGDEGSAYDIGRETLRTVTRQLDGREPPTSLRDIVVSSLGFSSSHDLVQWVYEGDRRKKIASVAPLAYKAALEGDRIALRILKKSAEEIALCVTTAIERLELRNPLVSYSGSVLEKNDIVRENFERLLKRKVPGIVVRKAPLFPVFGAILLARRSIGEVDENFVRLLMDTQKRLSGR